MKTVEYFCCGCGISCVRPAKGNFWGKFCSNACQMRKKSRDVTLAWLEGKHTGWSGKTRLLSPFVRAYLWGLRGTACEECGWDKRHPVDDKVLTEIDHIDGDAENCSADNLKILCPNCHSMTPTFRARNKGSKRDRS